MFTLIKLKTALKIDAYRPRSVSRFFVIKLYGVINAKQ